MAHISAFHGVRYDLGHVGNLSDVVGPPYDVIDEELQSRLYDQHAANIVRLILNRDEPADDEDHNRYSRAARLYRNWRREGLLFAESRPALYVYHQIFQSEGHTHTRRGFMCRMGLERFGEGDIHPHEETHPRAKADRLKLWKTCRANLSPIFGLYPDPENQTQQILESAVIGDIPLEATDQLGNIHRVWPITDLAIITAVCGAMGDRPIYIADGHHRYETACQLRDDLAAEHDGTLPPGHPASSVLMMCVSMSDPGMLVLPTHRLFRGIRPFSSEELADRLQGAFELETAGHGPTEAADVWNRIQQEQSQQTLGFYSASDSTWMIGRLTEQGYEQMGRVADGHSDDWQSLAVSLLHTLVVDSLLDAASAPAPKYVHTVDEVIDGLVHGDTAGRDHTGQQGSGEPFQLAALIAPASLEHIRTISGMGERMPAKSTYFFPKLLSGLVINPLE